MLRRFGWILLFLAGLVVGGVGWWLISMFAVYLSYGYHNWEDEKIASALFGFSVSLVFVIPAKEKPASEIQMQKRNAWMLATLVGSCTAFVFMNLWGVLSDSFDSSSPSVEVGCAAGLLAGLTAACARFSRTRILSYGIGTISVVVISPWAFEQCRAGNIAYGVLAICSIIHWTIALRLPCFIKSLSQRI